MPPISFSINDIHKEYGERVILDGISLSFYLGAKIGIVGPNGSGKSTLLKIMAGVDKDFHGEVTLKDGVSILLVEQEPKLNFDKDVRGNIEEAVAPLRAPVFTAGSASSESLSMTSRSTKTSSMCRKSTDGVTTA